MGNWIDDEAKQFLSEKDLKQRKAQAITNADVWASLTRQIEYDANQINQHPTWKNRLGNSPLKVSDHCGGYYNLQKTSYPLVNVRLINNSEKDITVVTETSVYRGADIMSREENFEIESNGTSVFLLNGNERLLVPTEASQHLFKPIIEALKI